MGVRLRLHRGKWLKFWAMMATGSIDGITGEHIPYVRDGVTYPPRVELWIGPFDTYRQAMEDRRS